jgi:hypothetical protein
MRPACPLLKTARAGVCLAALAAFAAGCAGRTTTPAPPDTTATVGTTGTATGTAGNPPDCTLIDGTGAAVSIVGLITPPLPANAPAPSNDDERLVFRHLYETLVQIDCAGAARPGLAERWAREPGGTTWTLTLREGARFSDGTPVTAPQVLAAWTDRRSPAGDLRADVRRHLQAARAIDERTLAITLHEDSGDAPVALAEPALAVAAPQAGVPWPLGTTGLTVTASSANGRTALALRPAATDGPPAAPAAESGLQFLVAPAGDGRDLLDAGIDLLLTRDPAVLSYAATLAQFETRPLPWTRTYVFVTPENAAPSPLTADARRALAEDAVRGEARGADTVWWEDLSGCGPVAEPAPAPALTSTRIVYDGSDPVARDLAERIVALSVARRTDALAVVGDLLRSPRTGLQATGLAGPVLETALARGNEAGYLLALRRPPVGRCAEMRALAARAPWIAPAALVPLVETRHQAIVRRGRAGLTVEGDGIVTIDRRVR